MKVVVIGGGAAGMSAASRVRRLRPDWEVEVYEETGYVSHAPCGLPYFIEGLVKDKGLLSVYTPEYFIKKRKIMVNTYSKVIDVDHRGRKLKVLTKKGEKEVEYDKLIIATGAKPFVPDPEWLEVDKVFTLRHISDGERIREAITKDQEIVIVGAGYVGIEMAEALGRLGKKVTILEALPQVMPALDPEVANDVEDFMKKRGIRIRKGEKVKAVKNVDGKVVLETEKNEYKADSAIIAMGVRPDVDLALKAGAKLGETGGIKVNEHMWAGVEGLYAAGDNIEVLNLVTGKPSFIPLAPPANKEGYVAGDNAAGGRAVFPGVVGSAITKFYSLEIGMVGINEKLAKGLGLKVKSSYIKHPTRAHYYPGGKWMKVKLVVEESRRILGGQIIGLEGVWGRVAALAVAVQNRMKVDDLFYVDLPYAPPYSPVWDALIVAARVTK